MNQGPIFDQDIDDSHYTVISNILIESFWKQGGLRAAFAFDKTTVMELPEGKVHYTKSGVYTQLGPNPAAVKASLISN